MKRGRPPFDDAVVVVADTSTPVAQAVAEYLTTQGARVVVDEAEVGSRTSGTLRVDALLDRAVRDFGCIDAVVMAPSLDVAQVAPHPADDRPGIEVVLADAVRSAIAVASRLRSLGGGRLVLVTPGPAFPVPGLPALSSIDGALVELTRALGAEVESGPVRVNAVAPLTDTGATALFFDAHPYLDRRQFAPVAVAPVVALLCHRDCTLRGQILTTGGGRVARVASVTGAGVMAPDAEIRGLSVALPQICMLDAQIEPRTVLDELLLVDV